MLTKRLEQLVHLDKFSALSAEQISSVWTKRFEDRPSQLAFTLDRRSYLKWSSRALGCGQKKMPLFVYPTGTTNWIVEHQKNAATISSLNLLVCNLDDYKVNQHQKSLWNLCSYDEFLLTKGICLFLIPKVSEELGKMGSLLLLRTLISSYLDDGIFKKWVIEMNKGAGVVGGFEWEKYKKFIAESFR